MFSIPKLEVRLGDEGALVVCRMVSERGEGDIPSIVSVDCVEPFSMLRLSSVAVDVDSVLTAKRNDRYGGKLCCSSEEGDLVGRTGAEAETDGEPVISG